MLPGDSVGKTIIYIGIVMVIIGSIIHFGGKFFNLGRLPGDIYIEKENFSFHFPVATSLIVSIILTVILNMFLRR